jgi:organic hydroperoxide reductase OsmC/OhrA
MNAAASTPDSEVVAEIDLRLRHERGFRFRVDFEDEQNPPLWFDEPPPLGRDTGPNSARVLAAAIGEGLAESLLFALKKAGADVSALEGHVHVELVRSASGKLRIGHVGVVLDPVVAAAHRATLERVIATFEEDCVVAQSVRQGIDVHVEVGPP